MSSTLRFHKVARKHEQNYSLKCIKSTRLHIIITPLHNASVQTLTSKEHKQECLFHHCVYHHIGENGCVATSAKKKTHTHSTFPTCVGGLSTAHASSQSKHGYYYCHASWSLLLFPHNIVLFVACHILMYIYIVHIYCPCSIQTNKQTNKTNNRFT